MSVIQFALRQPVYQLVQVHKLLHNVFIKTDTGDMSNGVLMGFGFIDIILEYLRICLFNNNKIPYSLMLRPEINYTPNYVFKYWEDFTRKCDGEGWHPVVLYWSWQKNFSRQTQKKNELSKMTITKTATLYLVLVVREMDTTVRIDQVTYSEHSEIWHWIAQDESSNFLQTTLDLLYY